MIRLLLVTCLIFIGVSLNAQGDLPERALVSYRDGSYFIGNIIKKDGPQWLFELSTGDTIHLETIKIVDLWSASEVFFYRNRRYHTRKSVFASTSLAFHAGWESSVQWDGTLGMSLNEKFDVGVGGAISGHDIDMGDDWLDTEFFSLYGYGRYFLNEKSVRLYLDLKAGYAFPIISVWEQAQYGGVYLQPGIGITIASRNPYKWHFGLSQYLLHTSGTTTSFGFNGNPIEVNYDFWYNRTVFQFGLSLMLIPRELRDFSIF